MKAIILLFSFVSVICFISCGKTDSDSEPTTPTGTTPTGTTPTGTTPTANTPTGTTPTGTTPIAKNTPGKQKYQSPSGQGRHPPLVCNIHNYKDFIKKPGIHNCNLEGANLEGAYFLQTVDLEGANLERAKVTESQAYYLRKKGFSGFVVLE